MNNRIISLVSTIRQFWAFSRHSAVLLAEGRLLYNKNKGIVYMKEEKLVITFEFKFK
jgi:hypothetical protein